MAVQMGMRRRRKRGRGGAAGFSVSVAVAGAGIRDEVPFVCRVSSRAPFRPSVGE